MICMYNRPKIAILPLLTCRHTADIHGAHTIVESPKAKSSIINYNFWIQDFSFADRVLTDHHILCDIICLGANLTLVAASSFDRDLPMQGERERGPKGRVELSSWLHVRLSYCIITDAMITSL